MHDDSQDRSIQNTEHVTEIGGSPDRLFALIIGINNYASPEFPNLGGPVTDANTMKQYLRETLHVPEVHIRTLYDHAATRDAIIKAFRDLRDDPRIEKGDPIVIFYAGHGGELTAPTAWPPKKKIECLIPHDCQADNTEPVPGREPIPDRTIGALIEDISEAKGNNITVIFDCCHSGSGTRDTDEEYVPRRITRNLNIRETLDADIWGNRVGELQSGFAYHGPPRSHVLLAACGEGELAYEHRGRGQFTIALLKALGNCTVNNELTHVTYADLLQRLRLKRPFAQNPRCEGFNQHRFLFNGRVSADKEVYYPAAIKGGKYVIKAGLAHGVWHGVTLALYDDKRKRELGIVLVDEASLIEDFKTTIVTSVHLAGVSFAKLSGIGKLPLYANSVNLASALQSLPLADEHGTRAQAFQLVGATEAKLELTMEDDVIIFKVLDERVKRFGMTELPYKATLDNVARVLHSAAHYYWFLDFVKEFDRVSTEHEVAVDFHLLHFDYNEYGDAHLSPTEPGFYKKDPSSNGSDVIDFVVDAHAFYGIKLTNKTRWDLYLNVFIFNHGSFRIVPYYTQSTADKPEPPLKPGGTFTIGYGGKTPTVTYSLQQGQHVDVGFLKIFFATRPINLSAIAQLSPFANANARNAEKERKSDKWGVVRALSRLMSLSRKPESDETWFTREIPVVQRRYAAV